MSKWIKVPVPGDKVKIKFQDTFWFDKESELREWAGQEDNNCELGPPEMAMSGFPRHMIFDNCESYTMFKLKFG